MQCTPLGAAPTQQMWKLLAGKRTSVLPWNALERRISISANLCANKFNKTNLGASGRTVVRFLACVAGAKRGGEGGGGRGREGNPPPLFPFLPIPYPLPLSTPATQAMRFSANNRLPGSSPLWASEASHAFSSSEAVASPLACLSRYPPNGQLPCRQANNSQMCCAEAAVNI